MRRSEKAIRITTGDPRIGKRARHGDFTGTITAILRVGDAEYLSIDGGHGIERGGCEASEVVFIEESED
jgi:hypothetical protein